MAIKNVSPITPSDATVRTIHAAFRAGESRGLLTVDGAAMLLSEFAATTQRDRALGSVFWESHRGFVRAIASRDGRNPESVAFAAANLTPGFRYGYTRALLSRLSALDAATLRRFASIEPRQQGTMIDGLYEHRDVINLLVTGGSGCSCRYRGKATEGVRRAATCLLATSATPCIEATTTWHNAQRNPTLAVGRPRATKVLGLLAMTLQPSWRVPVEALDSVMLRVIGFDRATKTPTAQQLAATTAAMLMVLEPAAAAAGMSASDAFQAIYSRNRYTGERD